MHEPLMKIALLKHVNKLCHIGYEMNTEDNRFVCLRVCVCMHKHAQRMWPTQFFCFFFSIESKWTNGGLIKAQRVNRGKNITLWGTGSSYVINLSFFFFPGKRCPCLFTKKTELSTAQNAKHTPGIYQQQFQKCSLKAKCGCLEQSRNMREKIKTVQITG